MNMKTKLSQLTVYLSTGKVEACRHCGAATWPQTMDKAHENDAAQELHLCLGCGEIYLVEEDQQRQAA